MVLAEDSAPIRQPLRAVSGSACLPLRAISHLHRAAHIPGIQPHPAHKKTDPPKWACCYLRGRERRDKGRYSRSFT
jgi:hypothetical protein